VAGPPTTEKRPAASVIITYYGERRKQLARCLFCLQRQTVGIEIIIADDGGFITGLPSGVARVLHVRKAGPKLKAQSLNRPFRYAFPKARADYIIHCPPEMLVPPDAVERMLAGNVPGQRDVPTLFALSRDATLRLDEIPWQDNLDILKSTPDFWATWGPLCMDNSACQWSDWHLNFCGATRDTWLRFDLVPDVAPRGLNENWLCGQEDPRGILRTRVPFAVYHQWHPPGDRTLADILKEEADERERRRAEAEARIQRIKDAWAIAGPASIRVQRIREDELK
jgi:hypothetical protein